MHLSAVLQIRPAIFVAFRTECTVFVFLLLLNGADYHAMRVTLEVFMQILFRRVAFCTRNTVKNALSFLFREVLAVLHSVSMVLVGTDARKRLVAYMTKFFICRNWLVSCGGNLAFVLEFFIVTDHALFRNCTEITVGAEQRIRRNRLPILLSEGASVRVLLQMKHFVRNGVKLQLTDSTSAEWQAFFVVYSCQVAI